MDKIREEYEKEYTVYDYITFDKIHNCYIPTNPTNVKGWQEEDIRDMNTGFPRYRKGYKARDKEVKNSNQDCKNLVEVNNNQAKIMESKDEEIKKLEKQQMDIHYYLMGTEDNRDEILENVFELLGYQRNGLTKDGE
jgi:hypothetical protein